LGVLLLAKEAVTRDAAEWTRQSAALAALGYSIPARKGSDLLVDLVTFSDLSWSAAAV
jgi:hypothetical protein